ncbi:MAG: ATP-binding protein [Thermodesulfobacteriota bacterium]|nr:ATP-binding protein [Thermodesulfobacteriota bacterium]
MPQKIIYIPRINDSPADFAELFRIWDEVNDYFEDVKFDFSQCGFLRPNAVAFLGGLARLIESRMGTVVFDWGTLWNDKVMTNLRQNGFAGAFDYPSSGWDGNSIPYREDLSLDMNGIMDHLTYNWIGKGWVHVSQRLSDAIVGHVWEIYNNAFEHSGSEIGVFSCGQHFPEYNELLLSVVDFGQGIPAKVRKFLSSDPRAEQLTAAGCLRWAFQRGTTTKPKEEPGGLGLDLLKEFVQVNQGKLEVYSNEGYALIDKDGERFTNLTTSFEGTVFHITLRCDENLYRFADETNGNIPF